MAFQNLRTALFFVGDELRHITFTVANFSEPLGSFRDILAFHPPLQRRRFLLETWVEKLLPPFPPVNRVDRFKELESKLIAVGLKKIVRPLRQPIDHFR